MYFSKLAARSLRSFRNDSPMLRPGARYLTSVIPEGDWGFREAVDKYYDRAAALLEDRLVESINDRSPESYRRRHVNGILRVIKPCNTLLSINFPIKKDNGNYEMISAWRAQHSHHRKPCYGGKTSPAFLCHEFLR